jgi:membrane-bound lytic murein transglycosylase F
MIGKKSTWFIGFAILLACLVHSIGCRDAEQTGEQRIPPPVSFDLDSIKKRGKIILLTENSATTYYQYRGHHRGYDYELVKAFAKSLGVKLEVRILDDVDQMFIMLNKGEGDIIASNLTALPERKKFVKFSDPLYQTRQILVQRSSLTDTIHPGKFIADTAQLDQKPIWVHRYSSFYSRLKELEKNLGKSLDIREAPGEMSTDDLLRLTAQGAIDATVTDENLSLLLAADFPDLDLQLALTGQQDIGWAIRSNAGTLETEMNNWLREEKTKKLITKTYKKYFGKEQTSLAYRGNFTLPSISGSQISAYDSLFKKYAPECGWDWKLLAALVFQESRFNPYAESWSGAFGLMQLMPETALKFGCDTSQREEENIRAGVKYIKYLERIWKDRIPNKAERVKFVLASYNIGPGHVFDAQQIARSTGKADTLWDDHVAECLLLKTQVQYYSMEGVKHGYCRAQEPFHFVRKITAVYDYYKTLTIP